MTNQTRPAASPSPDNNRDAKPQPRFVDPREDRRTPLGKVLTDEEARLAAEIEKLRD